MKKITTYLLLIILFTLSCNNDETSPDIEKGLLKISVRRKTREPSLHSPEYCGKTAIRTTSITSSSHSASKVSETLVK